MSELIDNLKKLCEEHEKQLSDLRWKIRLIDGVPKAKALVGKCFRYQNGYGLSTRKWWVYKRIIGSVGDRVITDTFEQDPKGKIEIRYGEDEFSLHFISGGAWVQISEKKFFSEYSKLAKSIIKYNKKGK